MPTIYAIDGTSLHTLNRPFEKWNFRGMDLRNASISCESFWKVSFEGANLEGANLHKVNFCEANFRNANLRNTKFSRCNLIEADLTGADLTGTDFYRTFLNDAILADTKGHVIVRKFENEDFGYTVIVYGNVMQIGCQLYPIDTWKRFTYDDFRAMDYYATTFDKMYRDEILAMLDTRQVAMTEGGKE